MLARLDRPLQSGRGTGEAVKDNIMKIWKICLIAAQLMLVACASSDGSGPPPTGDDGSNAGGKSGGGSSYLTY